MKRFLLATSVMLGTAVGVAWAQNRSFHPIDAPGLLIPTRPGYAKPALTNLNKTTQQGILDCDILGACMVRNMPLLTQTDPRLDADVKDMGPVGCYDTSILTVILTALANRGPKLATLYGRVKELDQVQGDPAKNIPKEVKQLSWFYRIVKEAQKQAQEKPGKQTVFPLYFPEVVASFNQGKILEMVTNKCDPYKYGTADSCQSATNLFGSSFRRFTPGEGVLAWTNEAITNLMRQNYVLLIAYGRYRPKLVKVGNQSELQWTKESQHKVVFSGFQKDDYPLLINDVGDGQRYRVRLRAWTAASKPANANPVVLEYEGAPAEPILFVEHVDALRLR
ncbi:MAG: hypothetical protein NZL92_03930 [Gloeomargarita sp. SKYG116]|nr:hypothetical protein [Gloeomargarita sp. SKYG116]MCS7226626.1 hypothetical protein [Gloeomargarita sp. SKYB31]MDW8400830.1 hypothetical protein [Gloeomargarita sp. SKYGB_i_bin116]